MNFSVFCSEGNEKSIILKLQPSGPIEETFLKNHCLVNLPDTFY